MLWRDATTPPVGPDAPDGYLERRPVDYTGSASMLVRAATWDAVGGMGERFFPAYFVDVDLEAESFPPAPPIPVEGAAPARDDTGAELATMKTALERFEDRADAREGGS